MFDGSDHRAYDFVQILPACGPNTYQIGLMYGET